MTAPARISQADMERATKAVKLAGLKQCSMHGLRKATSRRVAESGGTDAEGKAVTGHIKDATFAKYRERANRVALADRAMSNLAEKFDQEEDE